MATYLTSIRTSILEKIIDTSIDSMDNIVIVFVMDGIHNWRNAMHVVVTENRFIEVKKSIVERLRKASHEGLCVACMQPLDSTRTIRGCHERCHKATMRMIEVGKTTEADRVSQGKLLEKCQPGRKPSNPVTLEVTR